jgi:hypothetical protein
VVAKAAATLEAGHRVWLLGDMEIPAPGSPAPAALPPPPLQMTGWLDTPYIVVWGMQLSHFIGDHAERFEAVPIRRVGVNQLENLPLAVAEGWQTNIVSPPRVVLPIK